MFEAERAVQNAIPVELKLAGYATKSEGELIVRFIVQPQDKDRITVFSVGARFQAVLVEIGDDEQPV